LIIIDGLDECESQRAQCEFIELIGDHLRSFPDFPLICSRPNRISNIRCRRRTFMSPVNGKRYQLMMKKVSRMS
jgi:hypothetical protein